MVFSFVVTCKFSRGMSLSIKILCSSMYNERMLNILVIPSKLSSKSRTNDGKSGHFYLEMDGFGAYC